MARSARAAAVLAAAVAAATGAAPAAQGADVGRRCSFLECADRIVFRAADGEANDIRISYDLDTITIEDRGADLRLLDFPFPSGNGCTRLSPRRVRCRGGRPLPAFDASLGDGADHASIASSPGPCAAGRATTR